MCSHYIEPYVQPEYGPSIHDSDSGSNTWPFLERTNPSLCQQIVRGGSKHSRVCSVCDMHKEDSSTSWVSDFQFKLGWVMLGGLDDQVPRAVEGQQKWSRRCGEKRIQAIWRSRFAERCWVPGQAQRVLRQLLKGKTSCAAANHREPLLQSWASLPADIGHAPNLKHRRLDTAEVSYIAVCTYVARDDYTLKLNAVAIAAPPHLPLEQLQ